MKIFSISLFILFISCNKPQKKILIAPTDAIVTQIIKEKYTEQNKLDGTEFVTVDTIVINEKEIKIEDNSCVVKFHIQCSFQPAALPPEYQTGVPDLNTDSTIKIVYKNSNWKLNLTRH